MADPKHQIDPIVARRGRPPKVVAPTPSATIIAALKSAPVAAKPSVPVPATAAKLVVPVSVNASAPTPKNGPSMATRFTVSPESIQSMFADMQTRAKASVEKTTKLAEEMGEFAKGNVEAVTTSCRIAAKGSETLGREAVEYGKKSFEGAAAALKSMAAAKSPTEFFKLQSDYARASLDAAVSEGGKLSETWLKLFGEIAQPLSNRAALAADKIKAPNASVY